MSDGLGRTIGALLQGTAQGFLEAKAEDKIRQQEEKNRRKLAQRETAKLLLQNPDLRPEAQAPILAFLADAPGSEKPFLEVTSGVLPGGEVIPEVQTGVPPVVDQQGKLDPKQNQAFALPTEGPVPLDLPPAESFAPLEDFTIGRPERRGIFRTREEKQEEARLLRREEAAEARSEEALLEDARIARRLSNFEFAISNFDLDLDDPLGQAMLQLAPLAAIGQEEPLKNLIARHQNPSVSQAEVNQAIGQLDLTTMKNSAVVDIIRESNPMAFVGLGKNAESFIATSANKQRKAAKLEIRGKEAQAALAEAKAQGEGLSERSMALALAGLGDLDVKDANTHIDRLRTLEKDYSAQITAITKAQNTPDPLTGDLPDANFINMMQIEKDQLLAQQADTRSQINRFEEKVSRFLGDVDTEEPVEITAIAGEDDIQDVQTAVENLPNEDPAKRQYLVNLFASVNSGVAFNLAMEMQFSDDPNERITEETRKVLLDAADRVRGPLF